MHVNYAQYLGHIHFLFTLDNENNTAKCKFGGEEFRGFSCRTQVTIQDSGLRVNQDWNSVNQTFPGIMTLKQNTCRSTLLFFLKNPCTRHAVDTTILFVDTVLHSSLLIVTTIHQGCICAHFVFQSKCEFPCGKLSYN